MWTFSSRCDLLLCRWKTLDTVLDVLGFRRHSWQYLARWARSAVSVHSISEKVSAWRAQQMSSAYINLRLRVTGRSFVYRLNKRLEMIPLDRSCTTFYQLSTVKPSTVTRPFHESLRYKEILVKYCQLHLPPSVLLPPFGQPTGISPRSVVWESKSTGT